MITYLRSIAASAARWVLLIHPAWLLIGLFLGAALSAYYAATHLTVDTDTAKMLDPDLPFMQQREKVETLFPQDKHSILLVVDSPIPEVSETAARRLRILLSPHSEAIQSIYLPTVHPFFDRQGLLYLETSELESLVGDLAKAQPFIAQLYEDFSLESLLSLLAKALRYEEQLPVSLNPVAIKITQAIEAVTAGQPYLLSWQDLLFEPRQAIGHTMQFVIVSPVLDHDQMLPAKKPVQVIRNAIDQVKVIDGIPVKVTMTGEPVLEYEELISISRGTEIAGMVSFILICLALLIGFRSWKLTLATLITLTIGLAYSVGFAALTVGSLNLISVAFAVLYIGIGVDYATHLALRYREYLLEDASPREALFHSLHTVSPSLFMCALTTALAMYAFIPTAYRGISELGIIAGSSMFIVVLVTLTIMPALLALLPLRRPQNAKPHRTLFLPPALASFPQRHSLAIKRLSFFLLLAALGLVCGVEVDFNPVNLRDPNSESVQTFKELLRTQETSPMFLTTLAEGEAETRLLENRLKQLSTVEAAVSVFDLIPSNQEEKLMIIDDMALFLGPQLQRPLKLKAGATTLFDLRNFLKELNRQSDATAIEPEIYRRLTQSLDRFIERCRSLPKAQCQTLVDRLQFSLLATFPRVMGKLSEGLNASPFGIEDLPEDMRARWVAPPNIYRIDLFPTHDMNVLDDVREFVSEVREVYPQVTGLPLIYIESMQVIVNSFIQAFATAVILITLLLYGILRNGRDVFLVLLPLVTATVFTGAATAIIDLPFNYANIIALPLLFGLGVDSGIHMVHRMHQLPEDRSILTTSTARGIFFSALTTLFSFASLGLVSHVGIASMGKLLGLGLTLTLLCTFFILPAFAHDSTRSDSKSSEGGI
ncbi:MAG: MMPL family transporter [Methylothermaceae bacterium]|nr:MMPL family transporter [Methylothermaceae bacterium]